MSETIFISPGKLSGNVKAPASKSFAHRALICAALASSCGSTTLTNIDMNNDIKATMDCLVTLGFKIQYEGNTIKVLENLSSSGDEIEAPIELNCRESGSTLRFMIPLAAALGKTTIFTGEGRLPSRPIGEFNSIFHHKGIVLETTDGALPLKIFGQLNPGMFQASGNISSQYITGLLMVLPTLRSDSEIRLLTPLESAPYVDITIEVMEKFGVKVEKIEDGFLVKGGQKYKAIEYEIEGDYSQAAFWMAEDYLDGTDGIKISGLNEKTVQGDKAIIKALKLLKETAHERTIDASQIPDLVPILAGVAALTAGTTNIINAGRLRIKESDRLAAVTDVLKKIGANIEEFSDKLVITGKDELQGGSANAWNDHRIAMMLAIIAPHTKKGIKLEGYKCVEKSYPNFFDEFARLGGKINELNLG